MSVKSAKNGKAFWNGVEIGDVRSHGLTKISEPQKYASSSTAGERREVAGHKDKDIAVSIYTDEPPMDEGDIGTLRLDAATGVTLFDATVHISRQTFGVDVDAGGLITTDITAGRADAV